MPRQTEPSVNNALESVLKGMLARTDVRSERSRAISGHAGRRPDILITSPSDRAPVVIEAEFLPAATVEDEANSRLGLDEETSGRTIEAAIALRYPEAVGDADDLRAALKEARLSYCVFTEEKDGVTRFPESGWLEWLVGRTSPILCVWSPCRSGRWTRLPPSCRTASARRPKSWTKWTRTSQAVTQRRSPACWA